MKVAIGAAVSLALAIQCALFIALVLALISVIGCDNRATGEACVYRGTWLFVLVVVEIVFLAVCYVAFNVVRWLVERRATANGASHRAP